MPAWVTQATSDGKVLLLDARGDAIPPPPSRVWWLDGRRPSARGTVVLTRGRKIGVTLDWTEAAGAAPRIGSTAMILPRDAARLARERFGADGMGRTRVVGVGDAGRTAWLADGAEAGFAVGDGLLAEHAGWPVARLEITFVDALHALASVAPLVANVTLAAGDTARCWPNASERRSGRVRSRVLRIVEQGPDREVWIPSANPETSRPGDRWVIERDGAYVGLAIVSSVTDRFVLATTNAAICRLSARTGDTAVRRPAADVMAGRAAMHLFRVDGPYALASAGEVDGLRMEMPLKLVRDGRVAATLRVNTVNDDHCGVTLAGESAAASGPAPSSAPDGVEMRPWDTVYVAYPPTGAPRGRVSGVQTDAAVIEASYAPGRAPPRAGTMVTVHSATGEWAGVVLASDRNRTVLTGLDGRLPSDAAVNDEVTDDETGSR